MSKEIIFQGKNSNYIAREVENQIRFSAEKCGMTFEDIMFLDEPFSDNPLITIRKPLGGNAVAEMLELWKEYVSTYSNRNYFEVPDHLLEQVAHIPESGMGRQSAIMELKDGCTAEVVILWNSWFKTDLDITPDDILSFSPGN